MAQQNDNSLVLQHARQDDSGRYICNVNYRDGTSTENYVDLVVKREYRKRRHPKEHPNRWWGIYNEKL